MIKVLMLATIKQIVSKPIVTGVGVDDMFVIVQCLENINDNVRSKPIHERIGVAIKHAGMSVLITSATDVLAFGVGASTVSLKFTRL